MITAVDVAQQYYQAMRLMQTIKELPAPSPEMDIVRHRCAEAALNRFFDAVDLYARAMEDHARHSD